MPNFSCTIIKNIAYPSSYNNYHRIEQIWRINSSSLSV